jgi:hypothetical protein
MTNSRWKSIRGNIVKCAVSSRTEGGFRRLSAVTAVDWHPDGAAVRGHVSPAFDGA